MNSKYLLPIKFITDEHSGILIKKEDELTFCIDSNDITIKYNENSRNGTFEVISLNKDSLFNSYNNLKTIINTMSLYNEQYSNWNIKLEKIDEAELENKIIELKPQKVIKDGNYYKITDNVYLNIEIDSVEVIACISLPSIIEDIQNIHEKIVENEFKNKEIVLDLYKNSFFQDPTARFLTYINILELLAPELYQEKEGIDCIDDLSEILKKEYKNKLNNDDYESIKNRLGILKRKSITHRVKQLPEKYDVCIDNLEYTKSMIKDAYDVRSRIAHEGRIIENFNKCCNFLEKFIPLLLKKMLGIN